MIVGRDYWVSVIQVSGGVVFGQLIGIIGFLFLTWIFLPTAFGAYASWLSIVAVGGVVCTGALETSLVRDGDGAARRAAAASIVWTAFFGATLFGCLCGLGLSQFPDFLPGPRLLVAASIGVGVFALAANIVFQTWAAAEGLFYPLTILRIVQSTLVMLFPLTFSIIDRTSDVLIWGHALGLFAALLAWLTVFPARALRPRSPKGLAVFWALRKRSFTHVLPALMIGALAGNLPQLAVNWRFGAEVGGHFALAQRVLGVPLSLVGIAVRDVFKRYASVAFRERGECAREFWSSFASLAFVAVGFGLVMLAFGELLFVLVFGETWRFAGQIAHWLLVMFVVGIVASPLTYLVYIVQREDFDLYWQSALLLVVGVSFFLFSDLQTTLQVYAFSYAALYLIYILACSRFVRGVTAP